MVEWLVGTYMFGQTGRDATSIRRIAHLEENVERMGVDHGTGQSLGYHLAYLLLSLRSSMTLLPALTRSKHHRTRPCKLQSALNVLLRQPQSLQTFSVHRLTKGLYTFAAAYVAGETCR